MSHQNEKHGMLEGIVSSEGLCQLFSRRQFLKLSGVSVIGISVLNPMLAGSETKAPLIIMEQAKGIIIADPTKCVGCRRCELACTEFNDGQAKPSMARLKVARNLNFGPKGILAEKQGQGNWGNGLIIQDLCKQCPHPVPCANACPNDAIVVKPPTNAPVEPRESSERRTPTGWARCCFPHFCPVSRADPPALLGH